MDSECSNSPSVQDSKPSATELELCIIVNGKPSLRPCSVAYRMRPATRLLFGTISRPSMAARGVELWIASLRACRVQPTVQPENAPEMMTNEHGGQTANQDHNIISSELPEKCSLKLSTWKTCLSTFQADIFADSERDFWDWVTESNRQSNSLQALLAQRSGENGSILWPAARANDARGSDYQNQKDGSQVLCLPGQAKNWAAPAARDYKGPSGEEHRRTKVRPHADQLPNQAYAWACSRPDAATGPTQNGSASSNWTPPSSPRLNPVFQWWLMGWPWLHQICSGSAATELCRWRQQLHLSICFWLGELEP